MVTDRLISIKNKIVAQMSTIFANVLFVLFMNTPSCICEFICAVHVHARRNAIVSNHWTVSKYKRGNKYAHTYRNSTNYTNLDARSHSTKQNKAKWNVYLMVCLKCVLNQNLNTGNTIRNVSNGSFFGNYFRNGRKC